MAVVYDIKHTGKSKLGLGVESLIAQMGKKKKYANIKEDVHCTELSDYISGITGGNVSVKIGAFDFVNAYAVIPMLDNSNPLITNSMTVVGEGLDKDLEYHSFRRRYPELTGGFDFSKNKFTGWAKELKFELCLGYRCIHPSRKDVDMNPVVATFILMHEFGHLIEKLLGVGTLVRESYILNQAHSRLMGVGEDSKRIKIVNSMLKEEGVDSDGIEDAINDDTSLYTVVIGKARGQVRSELDSYGYDQTGSESLADYFAVKQGYGIGALYLASPNEHVLEPDDVHYIVSWAISGATLGLLSSSLPATAALFLAGMAYSAIAGYSYDTNAMRYDNSTDRLERVLNGYVENIKSKSTPISNEELMEVKKMIKVLDSMPKNNAGLMQSIYEYVNPRGRKERNMRKMQKDLESLSNHRLSVKAKEYMS